MKTLLIIFLAAMLNHHGLAQKVEWKPTLGVNMSIQNVSNTSNKTIKPGFDAGLLIEIPLKENLSLEAGWFYTLNRASLQRTFIYPFDSPVLDAPQVVEKYKLNLLKAPISLVLRQNNENALFIGLGTCIKYNLGSYRNGYVVGRDEKYSSSFAIDTKSESKFGFGIISSIGKEVNFNKHKFSIRLNYDTDLSKWRYPTNFELEKRTYYSLRSHNFSLMISYVL